MLSKNLSVAAVALAANLVSAQTSTKCDPTKTHCSPDPAFGNDKATCDWTQGACHIFNTAEGTDLTYGSSGAVFTITQPNDAPTIETDLYLFFGRVDIVMQATPGNGIVTSAVLQSDDLDEIDIEFVGGDNAHFQSNYFSRGNTATYDRGAYHAVTNPTGSFHTYSIEWTSTTLNWILDGTTVRTLTNTGVTGPDAFPQTPMQVKLGNWVAGRKGAPTGTVQWAGGYTDFSQQPFLGYYKSISIVDYAGKSAPDSASVKEYTYSNDSGLWTSIDVVDGSGSPDSSSSSSGSASTTGSATKSKASDSTATGTATGKGSKTTMSTAASNTASATGSSASASGSGSGSSSGSGSGSSATGGSSSASSTASAPSSSGSQAAAAQNVAAYGGIALAGAFALAQLF